jgi:hypothetical protein
VSQYRKYQRIVVTALGLGDLFDKWHQYYTLMVLMPCDDRDNIVKDYSWKRLSSAYLLLLVRFNNLKI